MKTVLQVANKFKKNADSGHYGQIKSLHNAAQRLLGAVAKAKETDGSTDPTVVSLARNVAGLASRLLYNANYYGLTVATSQKYLEDIADKNAELMSHIVFQDQKKAIYNLVNQAANGVRAAVQSYTPESMPAQRPMEKIPGSAPSSSPKSKSPTSFENPLAEVEKLQEAERTGLLGGDTVGYGKSDPKIPAPPGSGYSKIPSFKGDLPSGGGTGAAMPKPEKPKGFNFGPSKLPEARLAPPVELPMSEQEEAMKPWTVKEQNKRIEKILKLGK